MDFYLRRSFRIMPAYFAYLSFVVLLEAAGMLILNRGEILSCLLFSRNYIAIPDDRGIYTAHFWSLAVEEHFYLIWPGILVFLVTNHRARWASAGLIVAVTVWRALDARYGIFDQYFSGYNMGLGRRTDTRIDILFTGSMLALLLAQSEWRERMTRWLSPVVSTAVLAIYLVITFAEPKIPIIRFWIALLVPLILAGTVCNPDSPAGRYLELPLLRWVGRRSYSLYLWQQLFSFREDSFPPLTWLQAFPANLICIFAFAILSHHVIERPLISFGYRVSARRRV